MVDAVNIARKLTTNHEEFQGVPRSLAMFRASAIISKNPRVLQAPFSLYICFFWRGGSFFLFVPFCFPEETNQEKGKKHGTSENQQVQGSVAPLPPVGPARGCR